MLYCSSTGFLRSGVRDKRPRNAMLYIVGAERTWNVLDDLPQIGALGRTHGGRRRFWGGGEFEMGIFVLDPRIRPVETRKEPATRSTALKLTRRDTRPNAKCRQGAVAVAGDWGEDSSPVFFYPLLHWLKV